MPAREELPSTLRRSPAKARETWSKAHDAAVEQYGEGERAHRTAFAALKHSGPSDAQAARRRPRSAGDPAGGVDANASKEHLMQVARRLDVPGRSRMTKAELVDAIQRANDRLSRKALEKGR